MVFISVSHGLFVVASIIFLHYSEYKSLFPVVSCRGAANKTSTVNEYILLFNGHALKLVLQSTYKIRKLSVKQRDIDLTLISIYVPFANSMQKLYCVIE